MVALTTGMYSVSLTLSLRNKTMHNENPFMTEYRRREQSEKNSFYDDPLERVLASHPTGTAIVVCFLAYVLLFLALSF
jgi:hypothetical protein